MVKNPASTNYKPPWGVVTRGAHFHWRKAGWAFFHVRKGYGVIETEDADDDVFFHIYYVDGPTLNEGQEVQFDIEQVDKGLRSAKLGFSHNLEVRWMAANLGLI